MILKEINCLPFSLNLNAPFQSSLINIGERKGFYVVSEDQSGRKGYGECSPLHGFSRDSLDDTRRVFEELKGKITVQELGNDLGSLKDALSGFNLSPSLAFAIEQSLMSLFLQSGRNLFDGYFGRSASLIAVNAVIGFGTDGSIINLIKEKLLAGYTVFKIKVGRESFEDDYSLLNKIRTRFGETIKLRLDANRKWSFDCAAKNLSELKGFNIEYIEEPFDLNSNPPALNDLSIPVAADESAGSFDNALRIINDSSIEYIILKPMILGGIYSSFEIIKRAEKLDKKVILSSSFESGIGKSALVMLASLTGHSFAHGLDTDSRFNQDIYTDPYPVNGGVIQFDSESYPPNFDLRLK